MSNQAALLIIDVQKGLFEKKIPVYKANELLNNISLLVERAHLSHTPVVYIQHSNDRFLAKGSDGWQLHPHLEPLNTDIIIPKQHGNAFEDTPLKQELDAQGVKTVVVTGLVTHGCVQATCLGAKQAGYHVVLVRDGHSNYHKNAAGLIDEWNQKLCEDAIEVRLAQTINFEAV